MGNLYCIAEFKARDNKIEELYDTLKWLENNTHKEEGCILYEATKQINNQYATWKSEYDCTFIEKWENLEIFEKHCNMEYITSFLNKECLNDNWLVEKYNVRVFSTK